MDVDFNKMWTKARTTTDEAESVRVLAKILSSKDGRTFILDLGSPDAELCIEILDRGLVEYKLRGPEKHAFFNTLRRLGGKHARLPNSMVITDEINISTSSQVYSPGVFAETRPGQYKGCTVAVRTLNVARAGNYGKVRTQFCKEVILWNSLAHPNILQLTGVLGGIEQYQLATVSEWMEHGNIMDYIKKNATNRLKLLHDAVKGLKYLHEASLTHGDLKGTNVLMTNDTPPRACLADFAFTNMVFDQQSLLDSPIPTFEGGTLTFMAPELLAPSRFGLKSAVPTQEGDVYAFGLVILQVLTGVQPFRDANPLELAYQVSVGVRPEKPADAEAIGLSESLWKLIQKCWDGDKARRPQIQEVVTGVGDFAAAWNRDMPPGGTESREGSISDEDSDEPENVGMFEPYRSDDEPVADSTPGASRFSSAHVVSPQPSELGTDGERPGPVSKHPDRGNPSSHTTTPPRKRDAFKQFLNKVPVIFGRKPTH